MSQQLNDIREQRKDKVAGIFKYLGLIMGVFYILIGVSFYFFPFLESMATSTRTMISILLILYGCFRFYRAIRS